MTVALNYDEAKRLVEAEIAKEGADYVYSRPGDVRSCVNVEKDERGALVGSCLVGRALLASGVAPGVLHEWQDSDIHGLNCNGVVKLTTKALHFLGMVQSEQDQGISWGRALLRADLHVTDSELYGEFDDTLYV